MLKEKIVRNALKQLSWSILREHLVVIGMSEAIFTQLIGHLRRSRDLIYKRPDLQREAARRVFFDEILAYIRSTLGDAAGARLDSEIATLQLIEEGYREIVRTVGSTVAAQLSPETRVAAAISRAASTYHELMQRVHRAGEQRDEIILESFRIGLESGGTVSPDDVLTTLVGVLTRTLVMEAYENHWIANKEVVTLPCLPVPTDDEIYKAGLTELLALYWQQWERMEQRYRFLGGSITVTGVDERPSWAPEGSSRAIEFTGITEIERYDYLANERLSDRLVQTFFEMSLQTNMHGKARGIDKPICIEAGSFVSAEEAHAAVSLCEILGYSILDDDERPGDLRLVEWLRGYATLQCLANERYKTDGDTGLTTSITRGKLVKLLEDVGLKNGTAERFVDGVSLRLSSRDLFDQPIIQIQNGILLLFGPGLLNADLTRVILSAIGSLGAKLARKGKSFEQEVRKFFEKIGMQVYTLKTTRDHEKYEFDVIVPWNDFIFLFECKNRTLSGNNPVQAYYFEREIQEGILQAKRQADALRRYPSILADHAGICTSDKKIVPCVLNSLPYSRRGATDGVYVTDWSVLKRFFEDRYFRIVAPHHLAEHARLLHRTAVKSVWRGDRPAPRDLLVQLENPFQVELVDHHTDHSRFGFGLGERTVVSVEHLVRKEVTVTSMTRFAGANVAYVKREMATVSRSVRHAKARHQKRLLRDQDRAWRKLRNSGR